MKLDEEVEEETGRKEREGEERQGTGIVERE